ncbi:YcxB family protein [Kitasatospora sp. NPDC085895]|uniref:YcxB family protein n=1 Tax=Kitasatospora sp. NPDC085895 TaxID=3155057 RepID=UPI00344C18FA
MHITVSYETTPQERVRAFQQALAKPRKNAWTAVVCLLLLGQLEIWSFGDVTLGTWSSLMALGLLAHLTIGTRSAARQQTPSVPGATEVTVTETGVTVRRPGHTTEIAWWSVRFVETADFFLLLHAPKFFTPILKRGFTPEQLAEVRALAAAGRPPQPVGLTRARPAG